VGQDGGPGGAAEVELLSDDLRLFSGYFWQIMAIFWLILCNSGWSWLIPDNLIVTLWQFLHLRQWVAGNMCAVKSHGLMSDGKTLCVDVWYPTRRGRPRW
jgi:hypothetical protein